MIILSNFLHLKLAQVFVKCRSILDLAERLFVRREISESAMLL